MRGSGLTVAYLVGIAIAGGPAAALADDAAALPVAYHKGQFGLSARLGLGVRGIATYDKTDYCGATDEEDGGEASVCTGLAPLAFDLEFSYGVAKSIELALEMRIGLQTDFGPNLANPDDGPRPFHLALGARFSFSEAARTKLFVQPMLVGDFTDRAQGNDFGVRGLQGFWVDLNRRYGAYVFVAETVELARWLSATFEVGVGFQGRYP